MDFQLPTDDCANVARYISQLPAMQISFGMMTDAALAALAEANAEVARLTALLVESAETIVHLTAALAGNPPTERSKGEQIAAALKFDRPLNAYGRSD